MAVGDGGIKIVANNDIIYQIMYERNKNSNDVTVYVVFEDQ